uniref:BAM-2-like concanavalin A-like domain-containing protein n=1 Tax=Panagrolaimus superbus TaxID=310955 RepID=A0A914YHZ6_9BILA
MLLRLPESNIEEKTIFKMASIQIKVGENGKNVIIEIDHSRHEFNIQNSKDDERLHLIAIKRNPSDLTFNIQVDNQIKSSEFFEDSIKGKIDIFVMPVSLEVEDSEGGENFDNNAFPGCISGKTFFKL